MSTRLLDPRTKPPVGAEIDWDHPLARGLEICVLLNEAGGAPRELVQGRPGTINGDAAWKPRGVGTTTTGYLEWTNALVPDAPFISAAGLAIVWSGVINTIGADKGGVFAGKHLTNGATDNPFDFRVSNSSFSETTNTDLILVRANAGGFRTMRSASAGLTAGQRTQVAVSVADATITTVPRMWRDGRELSVSNIGGTGTGTVTGGGATLRMMRHADGAPQLDGEAQFLYVWRRPLTANEAAALATEPYAFLVAPPPRVTIIDLAPLSGGVVSLSGTAASASSARAALSLQEALTGKAATSSSARASMTREVTLVGNADEASYARAALSLVLNFVTRAGSASHARAQLSRAIALQGKASTSSSARAAMTVTRGLTGKASTASSAKATSFDRAIAMSGKAATSSSAHGLMVRAVFFSGHASTANQATADLWVIRSFVAVAATASWARAAEFTVRVHNVTIVVGMPISRVNVGFPEQRVKVSLPTL